MKTIYILRECRWGCWSNICVTTSWEEIEDFVRNRIDELNVNSDDYEWKDAFDTFVDMVLHGLKNDWLDDELAVEKWNAIG